MPPERTKPNGHAVEYEDRTVPEHVGDAPTQRTHWARRWVKSAVHRVKPLHFALGLIVSGVLGWAYLADHFQSTHDADIVHASTIERVKKLEADDTATDRRTLLIENDLHWIEHSEEALQHALGIRFEPAPEHAAATSSP